LIDASALFVSFFVFAIPAPAQERETSPLWRQKVEAARAIGIDTTAAFRKRQAAHREALLCSRLADLRTTETDDIPRKRVRILQILRRLPQHIGSVRLEREKAAMDSLYQTLGGADDATYLRLAKSHSDDTCSQWIAPAETVAEVERVAFALRPGEVSPPFLSPEGIHIVKLLERESPSARHAEEGIAPATVERLKAKHHYLPQADAMAEARQTGHTEQTLFTIDGRPYSGALFDKFSSSHPRPASWRLDAFVLKSLLDAERDALENQDPEFLQTLRTADEKYLVDEVTRIKVEEPAENDHAGQADYFRRYIKDYPLNKKTAKRVKKLLKKRSKTKWEEALAETLPEAEAKAVARQVRKDYRAFLAARWELELEKETKDGKRQRRL
jgi:peptidyl-prolyl cis-trans isomerase SurA